MHDQLVSLWNRATGGFHSFESSSDLFLLRHSSKHDALGLVRRDSGLAVVVVVVVGVLVVFVAQGRIRCQPPVRGLFLGFFLRRGRLSGLAVDLLVDFHRRWFLFPVVRKPASRLGGRGSLGTTGSNRPIGRGGFFVLCRGFPPVVGLLGVLRGTPRRGLGLLLSSVGDYFVCLFGSFNTRTHSNNGGDDD